MKPVLSAEQILEVFEVAFPDTPRGLFRIERMGPGHVRCTMGHRATDLRPGGTIQGPALMALADIASLFVLLAHLGPQLGVVTTSLHIDFLRRPSPGELRADAELLKLGKRLAVIDVRIYSLPAQTPAPADPEAQAAPPCVARASVTYALPG